MSSGIHIGFREFLYLWYFSVEESTESILKELSEIRKNIQEWRKALRAWKRKLTNYSVTIKALSLLKYESHGDLTVKKYTLTVSRFETYCQKRIIHRPQ